MTSRPQRSADRVPRPGLKNRALPALLAGMALVCALSPGAASAQATAAPRMFVSDAVQEVTAGLFCAPPMAGRRAAPETLFGWIHVPTEPIRLRAEGQVAPAVLGMGFGVRFTLRAPDTSVLRYTIAHPPMPPRGITEQRWTGTMEGGTSDTIFFQFDIPQELQPGDWTLSVARGEGGDELLLSVGFTVVPPEDVPELAHLCDADPLLSAIPTPRGAAG